MIALQDTRILVAITFHFKHERLPFLYETIKEIYHYPVRKVDFYIFTNTDNPEEIEKINSIIFEFSCFFPNNSDYSRSIYLDVGNKYEDPKELTWSHKNLLKQKFVDQDFDYFIYTEDDHRISYTNFSYFCQYKDAAGKGRLIPGFVRTEINYDDMEIYSTDQFSKNNVKMKKKLELDDFYFITLDNPYYGFFILDQELAREYINTKSFYKDKSKETYNWEISERSAMALTFESAPEGFYARVAVPVSRDGQLLSMCCIHHLPNNYANNPHTPLGKIKLRDVISQE